MAYRPDELANFFKKSGWLASTLRYAAMVIVVVVLGVYIGFLLFGTNSVEVLYRLHVQEKNLKRSIEYLKRENARLQKEYFELKDMEPE